MHTRRGEMGNITVFDGNTMCYSCGAKFNKDGRFLVLQSYFNPNDIYVLCEECVHEMVEKFYASEVSNDYNTTRCSQV